MICSKCGEDKDGDGFYTTNRQCKVCRREYTVMYERSRVWLLTCIYKHQKNHSKSRGHEPPTYNKEWLTNWLWSQPNAEELYQDWIDSGYEMMMKPSVDRKDDTIGYTETNIQLMTWKDNNQKTRTGTKRVRRSDGKEYTGSLEAARALGNKLYYGNISNVCKGLGKSAYGYRWEFIG